MRTRGNVEYVGMSYSIYFGLHAFPVRDYTVITASLPFHDCLGLEQLFTDGGYGEEKLKSVRVEKTGPCYKI